MSTTMAGSLPTGSAGGQKQSRVVFAEFEPLIS